jgi:tripartite-type tricarboxylate transporter receptor subunit TctC
VTNPKRVAALPDYPAVAEVLPGFELVGWYGIAGPARMARPLVAKLNSELIRIVNQPDVRDRIVADGSETVGNSPEAFRQYMLADMVKWAKLVKESGAKLE